MVDWCKGDDQWPLFNSSAWVPAQASTDPHLFGACGWWQPSRASSALAEPKLHIDMAWDVFLRQNFHGTWWNYVKLSFGKVWTNFKFKASQIMISSDQHCCGLALVMELCERCLLEVAVQVRSKERHWAHIIAGVARALNGSTSKSILISSLKIASNQYLTKLTWQRIDEIETQAVLEPRFCEGTLPWPTLVLLPGWRCFTSLPVTDVEEDRISTTALQDVVSSRRVALLVSRALAKDALTFHCGFAAGTHL